MRKSERFVGMDLRDPEIDFVALARSMGVAAQRVVDPQDVAPVLREAMRSGAPQLVDVRVADGFERAR
jgi:benzoylformate decarboxylase